MEAIVLSPGRVLVGGLVFLGGLKMLAEMLHNREMPYSRGVGEALRQPKRWLPWCPSILALGIATVAWVYAFLPYVSGLAVIALILVFRRADQRGWPVGTVKRLGQYSPGAGVVLALLLGRAIHEHLGLADEQLGWHIAAGIVSYSWTICGVNKLRQSGLAWVGSDNIALLLAERAYLGPPARDQLLRWFLGQPRWLNLMGGVGLGAELAGVMFCVPALRMGYALSIVVLMTLNFVIWGFIEFEWALIGLAVAMGSA